MKRLLVLTLAIMWIMSIGNVSALDVITEDMGLDPMECIELFEDHGVTVGSNAEFEMVSAMTNTGDEIDVLKMTEQDGNAVRVTVLLTYEEDTSGNVSYVDTQISNGDYELLAGGTRHGVTASAYYYTATLSDGDRVFRPYLLEVTSNSTTSFDIQYVTAGARFNVNTLALVTSGGGSHTIRINKTSPTANYTYSTRNQASYYYRPTSGFVSTEHRIYFMVGNYDTTWIELAYY